jgi:hypothetical protein
MKGKALRKREADRGFRVEGSSAGPDAPGVETGLTTGELAKKFRVKSVSIHRAVWKKGHYMGLRPVKLPNRQLRWSEKNSDELLAGLNKKADTNEKLEKHEDQEA